MRHYSEVGSKRIPFEKDKKVEEKNRNEKRIINYFLGNKLMLISSLFYDLIITLGELCQKPL